MSDHNPNAFRAAIKALSQVVAPAVDPSNPLAVEQLRLVVQFLEMYLERQPLQGKLGWRELELNVAFGAAILNEAGDAHSPAARALDGLVRKGQAHLARPGPAVSERQSLASDIAAAISALMAERYAAGRAASTQGMERIVLDHAKRQLDLKRAWFQPFGFESHPGAVPPLSEALAGCPDV